MAALMYVLADTLVAQNVFFGIFALMMVVGAIMLVTTKNVLHGAIWLVVVLAASAGQYLLLVAEFVAWVQVLIYIGAILVLFLFGIMLTQTIRKQALDNQQRLAGLLTALVFGGFLGWALVDAFGDAELAISANPAQATIGRIGPIGDALYTQFLIPFEVISVLLLAALVGAVVLARRDPEGRGPQPAFPMETLAAPDPTPGTAPDAPAEPEAAEEPAVEPAPVGAGPGGSAAGEPGGVSAEQAIPPVR